MQTDGAGIPVGVVIDGANRHDKKLVAATIESIPVERPHPTRRKRQGMCMDKGYDYADTREMLVELGYTPHVRSRGEERIDRSQTPGFRARRWVVERTHSWLNRYRRLLIRWEKKAENYLAFTHLACAIIAFAAAIEVHRHLGPGLLESVYEACLEHELKLRGFQVERQLELPVIYKGVRLDCGFRVDLMVVDQVVVEIKAAKEHHPRHEAQTLTYLRLSDKRVGLLLNFGVDTLKDGIKRLVNRFPETAY